FSPRTMKRAEEYLANVLRPAAVEAARAAEIISAVGPQLDDASTLAAVIDTESRAQAAATAPDAQTPAVDAQPLAANPVAAQPAPASEPQALAVEGIEPSHQEQYQALLSGYTQAGLAPTTADALLRAHYTPKTGFDADGLLSAIAEAYNAPLPSDTQVPAPSKPQRGRPTKEQPAPPLSAAAGAISDPDPDIQENARAIVADPAKLAQLRQMDPSQPLAARLQRAVNELIYGGAPPVAPTLEPTRPAALGPPRVAEDDLPTWSQLLAEFRAVGTSTEESRAILDRHYDPLVGFDLATLATELQARDTAAVREALAAQQNPRVTAIRTAAERVLARRKKSQGRDAELAKLVAVQEADDTPELDV
ncbi:MAG: hypothetical protein ACREX8_17605, partial [Gammaproteobacteria bacterium]